MSIKFNPDFEELIDIDMTPTPMEEASETFSDLDEERKKFQNHDLKADIRLKRTYFSVTRKITRIWVCFIMAISAAQFLARLFDSGFESSEFIALITTTTATLVGFWAIVGAYLFPKRDRNS